jgi:hypothetical protein
MVFHKDLSSVVRSGLWSMLARAMVYEMLVSYNQSVSLKYVEAVTHNCGGVCGCPTVLQPHIL